MLKKILFAAFTLFSSTFVFAQDWESLNDQVLKNLGNGDYESALQLATQARDVAKEQFGVNNADYSASLHNLASAHKKLGQYTQAEGLYWEALKIDKQVLGVRHQNYALSLYGLANLYKLKKEYSKAEAIYFDALDIMEKAVTDRHPDYSLILSDYGDLFTELGNFKRAESHLKKAKEVTRFSVGDQHQDYAGVLFNYGKLYKKKGNLAKADIELTKALDLYKKTLGKDHPDTQDCQKYIDNLYNPTFELYEAAPTEPAVSISPATVEQDIQNIKVQEPVTTNPTIPQESKPDGMTKEMATENKEMETGAIETEETVTTTTSDNTNSTSESTKTTEIKEVEEVIPPPVKKKTWNDYSLKMDEYTQAGDFPKAVEMGEQSMELARNEFGEQHENFTWISLKLAAGYENAGMYDKAVPLYERDLAMIEENLGTDNLTYKRRTRELIELYRKTGDTDKAAAFFKDAFYSKVKKFNAASDSDQSIMAPKMEAELAEYYNNSMDLGILLEGKELQNLNLALKGREVDAALRISNPLEGDIDGFQKQLKMSLKSNEAVIDFLKMPAKDGDHDNYYALVTTSSGENTAFVPLIEGAKIKVLLGQKSDSPDSYIQNLDRSYQLYQLIWEPLEDYLRGVNYVHISPIGLLNQVAFGGLVDYQKNQIVDQYDIYYHCSLRDFILGADDPTLNNSVAFFGGAEFGDASDGRITYMPATKDEVNTFKTISAAKGWTVDAFVGAEASEDKVRRQKGETSPGILHIATATVYRDEASLSGLAFSNANSLLSVLSPDAVDGVLTAKEITNMDMSKTNMVILSATETWNDPNANQGILALQRAFKSAGVNTVLFSQWKVPDKQTQELLTLFYFNHLSGMNAHKALAVAKQDIRKLYNSPYFWAGFILIE